jgi:hypothetical protein
MRKKSPNNWKKSLKSDEHNDKLRSLTYSLDTLMAGFYFWYGNFVFQIGGSEVDDDPYYPFVVPTFTGFGFVLSNGFSWHTPFGNFKQVDKRTNEKKKRKGYRLTKGFGVACDAG